MPEGYMKMKRQFRSDGMSESAAKRKAAKIWNSRHPNNPVGPNYEQKAKVKALRDKSRY